MAAEDATRKSSDAATSRPVEAAAHENAIASSAEGDGKIAETKKGGPVEDKTKLKTQETVERKANGDEKDATMEALDEKAADGDSAEAEKSPATPATKKKGGAKAVPKSITKKKSHGNLKRKSTGGPAASDIKYEIGQYVLAKMRSFPPWPAIVLSKELLPEIMAVKPNSGNSKSLETLGNAAWTTQYPIFYMGTYEYSWIAVTDLEPLPNEKIERGAGSKKAKKLNEAFAEAAQGFSLEDVKALQDEVMDLDEAEEVNDEEREIAEPSADDDGMEVDEDEASSDEKPKKKKAARGKKRKKSESTSDDEAESEKPAKTPKKASAASKPKTPKSAASKKTTPAPAKAKSSKSPANGVKTSKKAATLKDKASPPASPKKKATPAKRKSAAKSKDAVESEESEADKSDEQALTDPRSLSAEDQHKYILHRRHRLQKAFLNKDKIPPMEEEMAELSKCLTSLEEWHDMPAELIKATKIHKVLRGIMNVEFTIPLENTYTFKGRSEPLHAKWVETIRAADKAAKVDSSSRIDESAAGDVTKENGVNGDADTNEGKAKKIVKEAEKAGLPIGAANVPDAGVELVERKAETLVIADVSKKDAPAAGSSAEKEGGTDATSDSKAAGEDAKV